MRYAGVLQIAVCVFLAGTLTRSDAAVQFGINGGISKTVDAAADEFNLGFDVGAHGFIELMPNLLLGMRVAYNRWGADDEEISDIFENLSDADVEGSTHIIELLPSVRITSAAEMSPLNFFGQLGLGAYVRTGEVTAEGLGPLGEAVTESAYGDTDVRLGVQIGAGIAVGDIQTITIEVFPMYNVLFETDDSRRQYFTVNVGVSLRLP